MDVSRSIATAVLVATLAVVGCASKAHDQAEPGYDFASFDSYAWVTPEPVLIQLGDSQPTVRTGENELRIRAAIDDELAARGVAEVPFAEADVLVAFSVGTVVRYRLEGGQDSWIAGLEPSEPKTKGTLHVYLLHPRDEKEVWHGWTSKWLEKGDDPETVIRTAVAAIFARYPSAKPSK